jgi:hypothetical protein
MFDPGSFSFQNLRKSEDDDSGFQIQYAYIPSPDAEDQLAQAWDIIFNLILDDLQFELAQQAKGETC